MRTTNILLVGLGAMGKGAWLPLLVQNSDRVNLIGVVDASSNAFKPFVDDGTLSASKCYASVDDAFTSIGPKNIDGMIVVTPPQTHTDICLKGLKNGIPVLCEKPLCPSVAEAEILQKAEKEYGGKIMVAQNRRHTAFIHTMHDLVASGTYGRPGQVFINFRQIFTRDSFRDVMAHPLLLDMAIHHFDTIRYVLGQEPSAVTAYGWNPDWSRFKGIASAVAVFEYHENLHVVYEGTWHAIDVDMSSNGCDWRIECENGVIACRGEKVFAGRKGSSASGSYGVPLTPVPMIQMKHEYGGYLLDEFLDWIHDGKIPQTTIDDNIKTLRMVYATIQAVDTGKKTTI